MTLQDKNAVVYGGGGALGGAIARAYAAAGARVFLAGRTPGRLGAVADSIIGKGGRAEIAQVDALDERALTEHCAEIARQAGHLDIAVNAIGVDHIQGEPLSSLTLADFALPVDTYIRSHFLIAKAAARQMMPQGSGVVLALTTPASRMTGPGYLGHCVACAGVEALTRHLAGELGGAGVRAVCIRSHAIPEAMTHGSHSRRIFERSAQALGIDVAELMAGAARGTPLQRLPTLDQLAQTAVFLASDAAAAMTGAIVNLNGGSILD
ncbi:short-chain dehydrogenase [Chitiniphilus shinanonensis]|uniref:Short-chain dehydrogenase n=1 Tax=Chitiniphilus shinanonensis TaxID=553088 RepID=F8WST7_9NEIS|nr:SDR family oxidoreductase [Chitiniphilus shinanonensis]BAK53924.1 short-chain dehydrogenase/reductase [Chitiniphilus shinanonensis]GLS04435.1 short-chain dehydrogenase [Chitiniphilus shinanonensis]